MEIKKVLNLDPDELTKLVEAGQIIKSIRETLDSAAADELGETTADITKALAAALDKLNK